jgi:hypothetical protein
MKKLKMKRKTSFPLWEAGRLHVDVAAIAHPYFAGEIEI